MRGNSRADLTSRSLRFWTLTRYPNYTVVYVPRRLRFRLLLFCTERDTYAVPSSSANASIQGRPPPELITQVQPRRRPGNGSHRSRE